MKTLLQKQILALLFLIGALILYLIVPFFPGRSRPAFLIGIVICACMVFVCIFSSIVALLQSNRLWRKMREPNLSPLRFIRKIPVITEEETLSLLALFQELDDLRSSDLAGKLGQNKYLALQQQINPHFIYNLLDIIRGKILLNERESASDMIEATGALMRYSISNLNRLVTLDEELSLIDTYISLQNVSFEGSIHLEIRTEGDVSLSQALLPKMTLQPIVENAILHGFQDRWEDNEICISIFQTSDNDLSLSIKDNGCGLGSDELRNLNWRIQNFSDEPNAQKSIGLNNVFRRIRHLFGPAYGLTVYSDETAGTEVILHLPLINWGNLYEKREIAHRMEQLR